MVLRDIFAAPPTSESATAAPSGLKQPRKWQMASPQDRLAAIVAEMPIFAPTLAVLLAPLRRLVAVAQYSGDEKLFDGAFLGCIVITFAFTILYQTVGIALWGATPGKWFVGLRVYSIHENRKLTWIEAFWRSGVWCLEGLLLGLPWLSIFSHENRRPWHDRIADSAVLALDQRRVAAPPTAVESSMMSGVQAAFCSAAILAVVMSFWGVWSQEHETAALTREMEKKHMLCAAVGEAQQEWTGYEAGAVPSRISVAIAMHLARAIDGNCLEQESDFAFWNTGDHSLAYLAKGLLAQSADKEEKYLLKVCGTGTPTSACWAARIIGAEDFKKEVPVQDLNALEKSSEPFARIIVLQHLMQVRDFSAAAQLLEQPAPEKSLAYFFTAQKVIVLSNLDQPARARQTLQIAVDGLDLSSRVEVSRWLCSTELEHQCGGQAPASCDIFKASVAANTQTFENPMNESAALRLKACTGDNAVFPEFAKALVSKEAKLLNHAIDMRQLGQAEAAEQEIRHLVDSSTAEGDPVTMLAREIGIGDMNSKTKLLSELEVWSADDRSEAWRALGFALIRKFEAMGEFGEAYHAAELMWSEMPNNLEVSKRLAENAYLSGDHLAAYRWLEKIEQNEMQNHSAEQTPLEKSLREPTSAKSDSRFEEIRDKISAERAKRFHTPKRRKFKKKAASES